MTTFIAQLRELSGGKPVGFKICIGDPREFMAIVKAMVETGIHADFIVVDGGEGGTGAAPLEFSNAIGAPLLEGLTLVHNALVGAGLRDEIRIGASGKRVTAALICEALALGADWVNSARGFMFSVGCIQAQRCHTNRCPVGVTTQDPKLQRALVVSDKAERVYHFHRNTVHAVAEMIAAAGADHPSEIDADRMYKRISHTQIRRLDEIYPRINPGEFGEGSAPERFQRYWDQASADRFRPEVGAAPSASHA
jgi:glutamate synthase domain-containing protein 2